MNTTSIRDIGLHTKDTRDYVQAGLRITPAETALIPSRGWGSLLRTAYLSTFVAGCILFPEYTVGLTLGVFFLDIGFRYPVT